MLIGCNQGGFGGLNVQIEWGVGEERNVNRNFVENFLESGHSDDREGDGNKVDVVETSRQDGRLRI